MSDIVFYTVIIAINLVWGFVIQARRREHEALQLENEVVRRQRDHWKTLMGRDSAVFRELRRTSAAANAEFSSGTLRMLWVVFERACDGAPDEELRELWRGFVNNRPDLRGEENQQH